MLQDQLDRLATAGKEGGQAVRLLSLSDCQRISQEEGIPLIEVETAAIELRILPMRYQRNLGTSGWGGLRKLLGSCVAIVGLGGLGGWVVEGLARMGIGHLILMDADRFEENNLNRQLLATPDVMGKEKTIVAQKRVETVNPATRTTIYQQRVTRETLPQMLSTEDVTASVLVDAVDTLPARLMLQDVAESLGIPLVHGAIAGMVGQVMSIFPGDEGLYALYGRGPVSERGIETTWGNPAATPMMVSAWQIQEVVKIITGRGTPLRGRMLFMDAEAGEVETLKIGEK